MAPRPLNRGAALDGDELRITQVPPTNQTVPTVMAGASPSCPWMPMTRQMLCRWLRRQHKEIQHENDPD